MRGFLRIVSDPRFSKKKYALLSSARAQLNSLPGCGFYQVTSSYPQPLRLESSAESSAPKLSLGRGSQRSQKGSDSGDSSAIATGVDKLALHALAGDVRQVRDSQNKADIGRTAYYRFLLRELLLRQRERIQGL